MSRSADMYLSGEMYQQLGVCIKTYKRAATLSGKVTSTGVFLLGCSVITAAISLIASYNLTSSSITESLLTLAGYCQGVFLVGRFLALIRHEEMITPLHPELTVKIYTEGLIYRKGRDIQVIRWGQIEHVQRQYVTYYRKKKTQPARIAFYRCTIVGWPDLVLSASIIDPDELGATIEREYASRLLPEIREDYQAGKEVFFSELFFTRYTIKYRKKSILWKQVRKVEIGLKTLRIETDDSRFEQLTIPLAEITDLCILEPMLEEIRQEKGFEITLAAGTGRQNAESAAMESPFEKKRMQSSRQTTWVSSFVLLALIVLVIGIEIFSVLEGHLPF